MEFLVKNHSSIHEFFAFRRRCKQYQDGNDESVKTFRGLSKEMSILSANKTENRL